MSGISGVTGKMKPEVSAQRTGWRDGEGDAHRGFFTSMQSDTPTLQNLTSRCKKNPTGKASVSLR